MLLNLLSFGGLACRKVEESDWTTGMAFIKSKRTNKAKSIEFDFIVKFKFGSNEQSPKSRSISERLANMPPYLQEE